MSIQTDLPRIKNAKAAIKAFIEGKGITVPEDTLLDGMAALLESIEAGGGSIEMGPFSEIIAGTVTPAQDMTEFNINASIDVAFKAKNYLFAIGFYDTNSLSFTSGHMRIGVSNRLTRVSRGLSSTTNEYYPTMQSVNKVLFNGIALQAGITYFYILAAVHQ